ncbi:adenylylsulfate reductase, thioredoxin dependent [Thermoanaerobacterium thermosaccharolyticum DSM 571]|jgi:phosphoadenosine phosphosulfate reductase|uniref:Adenosine 5'-phosphosulfate reductase n=1 Tax=Thermoanaerobacterium thermosaccharolyticum (strain ATCC 7956 / DSM 571 / NCIMB 9385 / NCA 3814 / NCTC 13789 / WDCM 00135 / 2032) TaxID=580327 RepID=D9TPC1_THETC|nr:phosphoadenylyl-sulfate reductase [Thermoanaerobacterium thermosaccharolyticum]ADL69093.1 adenylylsulfate reductase, thioredoxin dependent [Thermoanaerobacterium thermosaccharolyticum DSM 571]
MSIDKLDLELLNNEYKDKSPFEIIKYVYDKIGASRVVLASSLSIEDQLLTDILLKIDNKARIFFIDTGRHFQSTYDLMERTMRRYHFNYEVYTPESQDLEPLIREYGPNLFYQSVDLRKKCCEIRKVKPLKRVLATVDGWICGLRREQSVTRENINIFEWDYVHSIYKINPIAFWTEDMVWEYIKKENIPYNSLYDKGFRSIGCQPCTRAVKPGEDVRSGRWWWEDPDKKECGLHVQKHITL